jgi:hypothetical protein
MGCKRKSMRLINFVFLALGIGAIFFSMELGKAYSVVHAYGPYGERIPF